MLEEIVTELRSFKGLTRKSAIGELLTILKNTAYDDAGLIEFEDFKVVVSTDGIVEDLVRCNPWRAGFSSVIVNVNDVVAKGANPIGYVCVISSSSSKVRRMIAKGINYGLSKYQLKFLKGHTHPDTSFDAIDAAVVGIAKNFLSSTAAKPGDQLITALDLKGRLTLRGWLRTFDSVSGKSIKELSRRLKAMIEIADKNLAHAARDISGPGIIGTLGMLCESSRVGAEVNIEAIPKPKTIKLRDWLITYPAIGFIISTDKAEECLNILKNHDLVADIIGRVTESKVIYLVHKGQREIFMNLYQESIFGLKNC
ncbi:MAG: AIR synthase-related protein [Candidatus Bathyarchaeia archaeon]